MQVYDVAQCLDGNDRDEIRKQQKNMQDSVHTHESFARDFKQKRSTFGAPSGSSGNKRRKSDQPRLQWKGPRALPALSEISQADAKKLAPPGAFLWKGNSSGTCNAKLEPSAQLSRSWRKYGEAQALKLALIGVWERYLEADGLSATDCPIAGLLPSPSDGVGSSSGA